MVKKIQAECGANAVGMQKCFLSNKIKWIMKSRTVSHFRDYGIVHFLLKKNAGCSHSSTLLQSHHRILFQHQSQPVSCGTGLPLDESDQYRTPPAARHSHHGGWGHAKAKSWCILGKMCPLFHKEEDRLWKQNVGQLVNREAIIPLYLTAIKIN